MTQVWRMIGGGEKREGAVKRLSRLMLAGNILIAKLNQPASQSKPGAEALRSFMDFREPYALGLP